MSPSVSPTPLQPVISWDGLLMGKVCDDEHGCVNVAVLSHLQVGVNGELVACYWDQDTPEVHETVISTDPCEGRALARILTAIASVALAPTQR